MSKQQEFLDKLVGKTIKSVTANRFDTADSCAFAEFEMEFTDGTSYSMQFRSMPALQGMYFPDDDNSESFEFELVEP